MRRLLFVSFITLAIVVSTIAYQASNPSSLNIQTDSIILSSSHSHILPGQCPTVTWDVAGAETILLNNIPVSEQGSIIDCVDPLTQPVLTVDGVQYQLPVTMLYTRLDMLLAIIAGLISLFGCVISSVALRRKDGLSTRTIEITLLLYISVIFFMWSAGFILNSTVIAPDGNRYHALFDDAFITMRYAHNLVDGNGAIWNIGEHIEGYSNPLWLLIMSLILLLTDTITAVLWMQLIGIGLILITAMIATQIVDSWLDNNPENIRSSARVIIFALMLWGNYTFIYYSLMGMEVSLQVLLLMLALHYTMRYQQHADAKSLLVISSCIGLSYLTHPDTLILIIPFALTLMLIQPAYIRRLLQNTLLLFSIAILIWSLHLLIRYLYYGDIVSTLAIYKSGVPLLARITSGISYLLNNLSHFTLPIVIIIIGLVVNFRRFKIGLLLIILTQLIYQGLLHGDLPPLAQYLHFSLMCILILATVDIAHLIRGIPEHLPLYTRQTRWLITMGIIIGLIIANGWAYKRQIVLLSRPFYVYEYEDFISEAIALNDVLTADAQLGVIWAGTVPYYTQRTALDFFGRTNPVIAATSPVYNRGLLSGFNKTDLTYAIVEQHPDYIETCRLINDNVCHLIEGDYAYHTYMNRVELWLRVDSSHIRWQRLQE